MKNSKTVSKALSFVICGAGLMVMAGWLLNIPILTRISPSWISMKFSTAVAFVASGVTLFFLVRAREGKFEIAQIVLSITSLIISMLMGVMFFSGMFGIQTGVENLVVKDPGGARSVVPGMPSVPTMVDFLLIALAAILTIVNPTGHLLKLKLIGVMVGATGACAIAGYILKAPALYFYIANASSAMAMPTALLFILIGTGLLCL
jgi:hypothetical protein